MSYSLKNKIIVALSGGVDSAVVAAWLLKQGHEVVGVFFRFFGTEKLSQQAKKIAKKMGIPLKIIDARKDFQERVIDYFVNEYKNGRTPNPCVACNKEMKFRLLFDLMKKYRADYVATGHYARLGREIPNPKSQIPKKIQITNYKLLQAIDKAKDQSYFLYRLTQKDLAQIIFPLGEYKKSEVKKIARKMKLPAAENESQDVCFLECDDLNTYLDKYLKSSRGKIVDALGNTVGYHRGLPFYTIGQRKGIEIGGTGPYWVVGKNVRKNELIVTNDQKKLLTKIFRVGKINWINKGIKLPLQAEVQIRYRAPKVSAIIKPATQGRYSVEAKKPLRAVTAGQSAVFYENGEVLGGGIITN